MAEDDRPTLLHLVTPEQLSAHLDADERHAGEGERGHDDVLAPRRHGDHVVEITHAAADAALAEELAPEPPTREEMLEAIPLHVALASGVDLDADDPALVEESGRRACVAERRAGGRCTAPPVTHSLLCTAHAGLLDASAGGKAKAEKHQRRQESLEERERLARLGPRAVMQEALAARAADVKKATELLAQAAGEGDLAAAKLLFGAINQAHGMPTQHVETQQVGDAIEDLAQLPTEELQRRLALARKPVEADQPAA